MSQDLQLLLERLTVIEGTVTKASLPKHGLNAQQKSVKQMPALFKNRDISPVLTGEPTYKKHPSQGYFVGGESQEPEVAVSEDLIGHIRRGLNDYLADVEQSLKRSQDGELSHAPQDRDIQAVKTIMTDDGREIRIHGNEHDGFVIKIQDKPLTTTFKSLDEAVIACEMYCAHRRQRVQHSPKSLNQDYIDEA